MGKILSMSYIIFLEVLRLSFIATSGIIFRIFNLAVCPGIFILGFAM